MRRKRITITVTDGEYEYICLLASALKETKAFIVNDALYRIFVSLIPDDYGIPESVWEEWPHDVPYPQIGLVPSPPRV